MAVIHTDIGSPTATGRGGRLGEVKMISSHFGGDYQERYVPANMTLPQVGLMKSHVHDR